MMIKDKPSCPKTEITEGIEMLDMVIKSADTDQAEIQEDVE